jgi:hypothetical protein
MNNTILAVVVVALALSLSTTGFAAPITAAGIQCTGAFGTPFSCGNINDDLVNDATGSASDRSFWLGREGTALETITINLGEIFTLDRIDLYNTSNRNFDDRGTLDFRVWISSSPVNPTTNPAAVFGTLILDSALVFSTGNPNPVQSFTTFLAKPTGQYLTFRSDSFFNKGAGLSELDVAGTPIPEPGTALLSAAAICLLAGRFLRQRV